MGDLTLIQTIGAIFVLVILASIPIFLLAIGAYSLFRWFYNNCQPVKTEKATVVSRREESRRPTQDMILAATSQLKSASVTFELQSGKQIDLSVPPNQLERMTEGHSGQLTYQGSRFKGFNG